MEGFSLDDCLKLLEDQQLIQKKTSGEEYKMVCDKSEKITEVLQKWFFLPEFEQLKTYVSELSKGDTLRKDSLKSRGFFPKWTENPFFDSLYLNTLTLEEVGVFKQDSKKEYELQVDVVLAIDFAKHYECSMKDCKESLKGKKKKAFTKYQRWEKLIVKRLQVLAKEPRKRSESLATSHTSQNATPSLWRELEREATVEKPLPFLDGFKALDYDYERAATLLQEAAKMNAQLMVDRLQVKAVLHDFKYLQSSTKR